MKQSRRFATTFLISFSQRVEAGLRADSAHAPRRQETPDVNVNVDTAAAAKRRRYEKQLGDVAAKKREETELMSRETIKLIRVSREWGWEEN